MAIGKHKGKKVEEAKPEIKMELIKSSEAVLCMEPEKKVISRSGDECVVALCDQWYLDYGEKKWRQVTQDCLDKLECYHDEVKKNFASTLDWLKEHACSRTYGLGSKLPWEESWLIGRFSLAKRSMTKTHQCISQLVMGRALKRRARAGLGL